MNILSFDIEEWYIVSFLHGRGSDRFKVFDQYLDSILDVLDEQHTQATFFVIGQMALDFPQVVKRINDRGHDIGCHSYQHTWLNTLSRDEVFEDTRQAVDALEQCIGRKVKAYRAPAFSIGKENQWAFETLAKCGIEYDASVFPAAHDFGGFPDFGNQVPTLVKTPAGDIKEFPITISRLLNKEVAFSGGGYFRLFPFWFVNREMKKRDYNICYFHIGDVTPSSKMISKENYERYYKEPATWLNRRKRHMKTNLGKKTALSKMNRLIRAWCFVSVAQANEQIDWENAPKLIIE